MSTGMTVLTPHGLGLIIGWRGLWTAIVSLADGRLVDVPETELRRP